MQFKKFRVSSGLRFFGLKEFHFSVCSGSFKQILKNWLNKLYYKLWLPLSILIKYRTSDTPNRVFTFRNFIQKLYFKNFIQDS